MKAHFTAILMLFEKYKLGEIVIDEIITSFDQIGLFELS